MANILYGVNGEGSGHSTRAREVILHLERRGHVVHVVSFDRGLRNLSESLQKAVAEENYETAASLRDQIKQLESELAG